MPINNNPFTFTGRMHRAWYGVTVLILKFFSILCFLVMSSYNKMLTEGFTGDGYDMALIFSSLGLLVLYVLTFFATIKRLRDVKLSPWWSLIVLLSVLYVVLYIFLIIVPSKWPEDKQPQPVTIAATNAAPKAPVPEAAKTTSAPSVPTPANEVPATPKTDEPKTYDKPTTTNNSPQANL